MFLELRGWIRETLYLFILEIGLLSAKTPCRNVCMHVCTALLLTTSHNHSGRPLLELAPFSNISRLEQTLTIPRLRNGIPRRVLGFRPIFAHTCQFARFPVQFHPPAPDSFLDGRRDLR